MLYIKFTASGTDDIQLQLSNLLEAVDTKAILDESAAVLLNGIRTRYLTQLNPDGEKWPESQAAKDRAISGRGGGTLYDTGTLYQSIQLANAPDDDSRMIATDVPYAGFVNYGTVMLPERIYMGISDEDIHLVEELIAKRIEKAMA